MTNINQDPRFQYFATKEPKETAGVLLQRAASFYNTLEANSYLEKLQRMWQFYHGQYNSGFGFGHSVTFGGEQGELVQLPVNHFRNIAQNMINMITNNRPVLEARAVNTDYKSTAQTYLANSILDYYMREKDLEKYIYKATEMAVVLGSGFLKMEWNATGGERFDYDEERGEFNYDGELEFSVLSPFDVVVDGTKENWDMDWILTRSFKNRYDIMAKYPELSEKIMAMPSKLDMNIYRMAMFSNDDTDDIPVYEFYHKPTESVPGGRYMQFLSSDLVVLDTDMPYREIPIFRITSGEYMGTPYGYSPMFDIYPIQESINSIYGTIMTNIDAVGVQNIWVPRGSDISVSDLSGGMNLIESDQKPEGINLTNTPEEVFKFLDDMVNAAEVISGVNSVARGNPPASLESGTALALVQAMALQYMSHLQQNYVSLLEDAGTSLVNILKDFAMTPKTIQLVGKNNRPYLKEFTGDDLGSINRVIVDIGNPLAKTTAGKVQIAEQLLQMKMIKSPEQYFQVLNTGRLEPVFQGEITESLLIQAENEKLMEGEFVQATAMDKHTLHINEHRNVINDPDLRKDITLVQNVQEHIQEHLNFLRNTDPGLLAIIGEQPLPPLGGSQPNPAPPEGPPVASLESSSLEETLGQPTGDIETGSEVLAQAAGKLVPQIPSPPPPFEDLEVIPGEG